MKLWKRNNSSYPAANLSDIGADTAYFPSGLPVCPVDGTAYTIDTTTGALPVIRTSTACSAKNFRGARFSNVTFNLRLHKRLPENSRTSRKRVLFSA